MLLHSPASDCRFRPIQHSSNVRDGALNAGRSRINHHVFSIPGLVLASENILPGRKSEPRDIAHSILNPVAMLRLIGANDLHVDCDNAATPRNTTPGISRKLNWIHAVGDYAAARAQVLRSCVVGHTVPGFVHSALDRAGMSQSLLNRIDTQMNCPGLARQFFGDGCLANARKAAKDDKGRSVLLHISDATLPV